VVDHLLHSQLLFRDDFAEVADPVRRDDVFPRRQAGFQEPEIRRSDRRGPLAVVKAIEQFAVIAEGFLSFLAGLDQDLYAPAVVMNRV
jgi:hypothetical protein